MACTYADGLTSYENKGICGLPEVHDCPDDIDKKIEQLAEWIRAANSVAVHTGAGISTSAGIPDFRGPKGVWTLEQNGEKPTMSLSFNDAIPTPTHMALTSLIAAGLVHHIVSQNVDGLHLRSGLPGTKLSELHGNMFLDKCNQCNRQFIRRTSAETVGQKCSGRDCPVPKPGGRPCRGRLCDTILDWEDELPFEELETAENQSRSSDLNICLGTTLQILPSGKLPLLGKKNGGKLVICNLQPTKYDSQANMLIHDYVDSVMEKLMEKLQMKIPQYSGLEDPTATLAGSEYLKHLPQVKNIKKQRTSIKEKKEINTNLPVLNSSILFKDINEDTNSCKKIKIEDAVS